MDFDPGSWRSIPVPGPGDDRAKKGEGGVLLTFGVSAIAYLAIIFIMKLEPFAAIPSAALVVYQTINFHH